MSTNKTVFYQPGPESIHDRVGAWFLGPKAENHKYLGEFFEYVVELHKRTRTTAFPNDPQFVSAEMQATDDFKGEIEKLDGTLKWLSQVLSHNSVPFWSPRYNAHMNMDVSMPGVLGYLTTMLFNPNNTAVEAGPLTTLIEKVVGLDLCAMLGYNTFEDGPEPMAWGHVTCGGTIANLESMWAARNLKFYPLSLYNATAPGAPFAFVASRFKVKTCTGVEKLFRECSTWELLNLTPDVILDLPDRLQKEFRISSDAFQKTMGDYVIQTVGKDVLERQFGMKPAKYFVATTKHYSWPKGAAITGIGSGNLIEVPVDNAARMKVDALDGFLKQCLRDQTPVYAVVAIMGSTEHGAVDPLSAVCGLRLKYQRLGLSFAVHADGAWGGYFASTLHSITMKHAPMGYVPQMALSPYTQNEIHHYKYADSFTIDPHKSGFLPYPGGALCYRDGRMRYLITWSAPYLGGQKGIESMGVYGVEGSKPGAAPVGTWLSHEIIGLHQDGYGALLHQAIFSAARMYTHWATMDLDHPSLIVVPFNLMPTEMVPNPNPAEILEQRKFIKNRIVDVDNYTLRHDKDAWGLLTVLGSDLCINAFACNFKINGIANQDVAESSYMNHRIYEELSMTGVQDPVNPVPRPPLIIMTTVMEQAKYKACLTNFKNRLHLSGCQDLTVLSNCVMSPFPTDHNFQATVAKAFQNVAEKVLEECVYRNEIKPVKYTFVMQGTDAVLLVLMPMFNKATHRHQLIIEVSFPDAIMQEYVEKRKANPAAVFVLATTNELEMKTISTKESTFKAVVHKGTSMKSDTIVINAFEVTIKEIFVNQPIGSKHLDAQYPDQMPFYLFSADEQFHIDHLLLRSPNAQITTSVEFEPGEGENYISPGQALVAVMDDVNEWAMQPIGSLPETSSNIFNPGEKYSVTVYRPITQTEGPGLVANLGYPISRGTVIIGQAVYIDSTLINVNPVPFPSTESVKGWRETWDGLMQSRFPDEDPIPEHPEGHDEIFE